MSKAALRRSRFRRRSSSGEGKREGPAASGESWMLVTPKPMRRTEPIGAVRLIGFGVTNIQNAPDADGPSLFPSPEDERRRKRERLSAALDNLRDRGMM